MSCPREPTPVDCTQNADLGNGWQAIWYPQMGGDSGCAAFRFEDSGCVDIYVWHDGEFPFTGESDDRSPVLLHLCDPRQFIRFGETLLKFEPPDEEP